jgi:hypothetical protein
MKVKAIAEKYKNGTQAELSKALASVCATIAREQMSISEDPKAFGRIRLLRYEKAHVSHALSLVRSK